MSGFLGAGTRIYTDEHAGYDGLPNHSAVIHSWRKYVKGDVHTNGIESHWALLKGGIVGSFHQVSPKHPRRYTAEFSGRQDIQAYAVLERLRLTWEGMKAALSRSDRLNIIGSRPDW